MNHECRSSDFFSNKQRMSKFGKVVIDFLIFFSKIFKIISVIEAHRRKIFISHIAIKNIPFNKSSHIGFKKRIFFMNGTNKTKKIFFGANEFMLIFFGGICINDTA